MPVIRTQASGTPDTPSSHRGSNSAHEISLDPEGFLHSVSCLGVGNLVLRGGGLSLFQTCRLLSFETDAGEIRLASDQGLSTSSTWIHSVHLIESPSEPVRFEIEMVDTGRSLTFYPGEDVTTLQRIEEVKERYSIPQSQLMTEKNRRSPEKGAWLNQNLDGTLDAWKHKIALSGQPRSYSIFLLFKSAGLEFRTTFDVSFFDAEGDIFRLAALGGETAIHLSIDHFETKRLNEGVTLTSSHSSFPRETEIFEDWIHPALIR